MRVLTLLVFLVAGVLTATCRNNTDLNHPCTMVKRNPDGGTAPIDIRESELPSGVDFVSTGVADCDDQVCVRNAAFVNPNPDAGPNDPAAGYCSKRCSPGGACDSEDSALDQKSETRLSCRQLLLDTELLSEICTKDPQKCTDLFGDSTQANPYYCARGSVDGGL